VPLASTVLSALVRAGAELARAKLLLDERDPATVTTLEEEVLARHIVERIATEILVIQGGHLKHATAMLELLSEAEAGIQRAIEARDTYRRRRGRLS
jgi:hypothetical protein